MCLPHIKPINELLSVRSPSFRRHLEVRYTPQKADCVTSEIEVRKPFAANIPSKMRCGPRFVAAGPGAYCLPAMIVLTRQLFLPEAETSSMTQAPPSHKFVAKNGSLLLFMRLKVCGDHRAVGALAFGRDLQSRTSGSWLSETTSKSRLGTSPSGVRSPYRRPHRADASRDNAL